MSIFHPPLVLWQFTDTHLAADPAAALLGVNVLDALRQVLAAARTHTPRPDLVLATGDLVHDESAAGYRVLAETFAVLQAPVYCLPGNHDDPALMRTVLSGAVCCEELWLAGNWQVILLDSAEAGAVAGRLPAAELARLSDCLRRRPGHYTLVCLHHPPLALGSAWLDAIGLANGDELLDLLAGHPQVRGVVWGHAHQEFDAERSGLRLLGTPSTCVQFAPGAAEFTVDAQPPGYRWLELHDDGRITSGVRRLGQALC